MGLRPFAHLALPSGDYERGLRELTVASETGTVALPQGDDTLNLTSHRAGGEY
ncbi:hypothetical protein [Candidatus Methylomirabilis limnetica]|uniref:hypothetical protein n=1 Tax=Candidatus Methylomirabilis limnetica TaxID=2033718 RepID=UPI00137AA4C2|nr:hypothetical protein [Candidatus Methylomirabilis limnetica]